MKTRNVLLLSLTLMLGGCGSSNRLADYNFRGATLAVVEAIPHRPDVFTDDVFFVDRRHPMRTAARIGSRLVREVESARLRRRLDSAMMYVDVSALIADYTLERSAVYLRTHPIDDPYEADYILDIRVSKYGIVAGSWTAGADFMINARVMLLDGASGREIWDGTVKAREPIRGRVLGTGPAANDIINAVIMSSLSVEEIAAALEGLAEFSADRLAERLQRDFIRSRN